MGWFALPPAASPIGLLTAIKIAGATLMGSTKWEERRDQQFRIHLGLEPEPPILFANSWVLLLSRALGQLAKLRNRKIVILPAYACNEFYKAVLLAGCSVRIIDNNLDGSMSIKDLSEKLDEDCLAVIMVNNTGVLSDQQTIKAICQPFGVAAIEDAGYVLMGKDENGSFLGSIGDIVIANMSEGKLIPAGGAMLVINDKTLFNLGVDLWDNKPKKSTWLSEALGLFFYALGSKPLVFGLSKWVKRMIRVDVKQLFSLEHTRLSEHYKSGDLHWNEKEELALNPNHLAILKKAELQKWNSVKSCLAIWIMKNFTRWQDKRRKKVAFYRQQGLGSQLIEVSNAIPLIKQPILIQGLKAKAEWEMLGISKQYPNTWPMASEKWPNALKLYDNLYTIPVHEKVSRGHQKKIIDLLNK